MKNFIKTGCGTRRHSGMTLVEVVVALAITGLSVGGIISGYTYCTISAERAGLELLANARAMERIEETRSAKWDTASYPVVDQLVATNYPKRTVALDFSGKGKETTTATIYTTISQISVTPPLRRIRVDCAWNYKNKIITNTVETLRVPDQ